MYLLNSLRSFDVLIIEKMLIREGKFSAQCFLMATSVIILVLLNVSQHICWLLPSYLLLLTAYLRLKHGGFLFEVGIRSLFLGGVFSLGVFLVLYSPVEWKIFGAYMCVMSFFHYSEFLAIALCNPKTLSLSSFLLNHSIQYNVAAIASWTEFALEMYFKSDIKRFPKISFIGFLLCIIGEVLRKYAMITGGKNFSHVVQTEKVSNHELVTTGIYSLCRHPSYVGWFYWSVGTQMLLLNPVCTIAYAIVSWRFFRERINYEEVTLLRFFGKDYMDYQKAVGTGLPGIKGFIIDE